MFKFSKWRQGFGRNGLDSSYKNQELISAAKQRFTALISSCNNTSRYLNLVEACLATSWLQAIV